MSEKIINTFQQRRQLAIAVAELANLPDQSALIRAAQEIHDSYPDAMVQAEILRNLDTTDSLLRGGLGHLSGLLPQEEISPALRSIAVDRSQNSQARLTAALLLSQFVGDPVPPALLSDISQTNEIAFQSLREAVEEGKQNRHILLEYVQQMRQAGDAVAPMILGLTDRLPVEDRIELLRLIALDDRETVSGSAISRLDSLVSSSSGKDALRALHVLQFVLPPGRASHVEHLLRRHRFSGTVYRPPAPDGWRALMSIADLSGWQAIWFVRMPAYDESNGAIIYTTVNHHTGQIQALGDDEIRAIEVPPQRSVGQIIPIETDSGKHVAFLEAPFDFARWRILELLPAYWTHAPALPPEMRLYSDLICQFARPEVPADLVRYFREHTDASEELLTTSLDSPVDLYGAAVTLLENAVLEAWLIRNRSFVSSIPETSVPDSAEERAVLVHAILTQLEERTESAEIPAAMTDGLRSQAAWFHLAGSPDTADLVLDLAQSVQHAPVSRNPLLAAIVEAELRSRSSDGGDQ